MKKFLLFIFSIFFGLISFSSANFTFFGKNSLGGSSCNGEYTSTLLVSDPVLISGFVYQSANLSISSGYDVFSFLPFDFTITQGPSSNSSNGYTSNLYTISFEPYLVTPSNPLNFTFDCGLLTDVISMYWFQGSNVTFPIFSFSGLPNGRFLFRGLYFSFPSSSSDITVYYNNGQTTSIACNGDNIITIDGLSTMSSISTFTPYFNINYTDQNNQVLTDSYSNSILYLSGGQYLKTYTGGSNNDWILNLVTSEDTIFTGYLPTFDVTGNITEIDTGNVFNNFAENSLTVLLSNIPNYIQYVIMFALLLFVLGIFRKLRK